MTLVFRAQRGSLQQLQIGMPDIMSTLSLAQSAWGWVGGLRVVSSILTNLHGAFAEEAAKKLAASIQVGPAVYCLFTSDGCKVCLDDSNPPFSEDFPTQLVGLSICAIAHVCGGANAVELFMQFLAPTLLKLQEAYESLHLQLIHNKAKILNEGATRGLTEIFTAAVDQLNLPYWNPSQHTNERESTIDESAAITDMHYVNSFLRWVTLPGKETYFTRSIMVVHVAACMKAVGYRIGEIQVWDGSGARPRAFGSNSVVLVTGGSWDTDPFLEEQDSCVMPTYTHHYHFSTAGAMFSNAFRNKVNIPPEVFPTFFEYTHSCIRSQLHLTWIVQTPSEYERFRGIRSDRSPLHNRGGTKKLLAKAVWTYQETKPSPISVRLASLFFPQSAEVFGICDERLSNPESLENILRQSFDYTNVQQQRDLATFRVITVSIVIAVASVLAGEDFNNLRHCIYLDLESSFWQHILCPMVDDIFSARLELSRAVFLLAAVHAGCDPLLSEKINFKDELVGWRNGIYTVQPALIVDMDPASKTPLLGCYEGFCANTAVRPNGAIISSSESDMRLYIDNSLRTEGGESDTSIQALSLSTPYIGPPDKRYADVPLYLNIERSPFATEPEILFHGRIGGRSIGTAGVKDAMITIVSSLKGQENCPGHEASTKVVNIIASRWAARKYNKPVGQWGDLHSFVSVCDNPSWALFLAGQSIHFDGRIVYDCIECTAKGMLPGSVLVGF
ncbi:hypothetical protein Aspvir_004925 [Aspergillus viridinutans]|uniref:Uncharacterized protein n=1 Tax=Aspergillus viridinutans TaxID=75553 RepID=A0A9P3F4C0_ASPVI|nr:uncharacterized protein Aspvir_004925 [Aspergillus viridinutans]GIK00896.1 hypothetical protein Aspvir_004925 [Aspergillus viridinutans]